MLQRASRDVKDLGLQMSMRKQMRTYVRSLLSGQRRIIIGFYSKNRLVEVREIDREEELLNEIITWNPDRCIEYLYGFITEVRLLDVKHIITISLIAASQQDERLP